MATSTTGTTSKTSTAIGIDLGTTYCCVGVFENGGVTIIQNELGKNTTPSHIAFPDLSQVTKGKTPPTVTVGEAAKYQADVPPGNAIYDIKRLIGRRFDDHVLQEDIKHWPFKVTNNNNSPQVEVNGKSYHPEQISAKVLAYLKHQAEIYLGGPVQDAVITVPAYFNDGQKQATKDAGSIAGLNVLRIINEPTAAAIAYNHQLRELALDKDSLLKPKNVLIFDLGGGTFDLALLSMEGNNIKVIAVDGDTHLGGQDFDNKMVDYCIAEFKKKHQIDLSVCQPNSKNNLATEKFHLAKRLRRIKNECERKKMSLTASRFVQISAEIIYEMLDLNVKITRDKFDSLNKPYFDKCIEIVERMLEGVNMSKDDVDDVVLVGGSSKILKIQEMLKNYFKGRAPCQNIRQDEAVAYGAAVQAYQMTRQDKDNDINTTLQNNVLSQFLSQVDFTDVIPHSIGIKVHVEKGDVKDFSRIIDKNKSVPCSQAKEYATLEDNQTSAHIQIYEGENPSCAENDFLGEFVLENLPNRPKGEIIDVQMDINDEGILTVTAVGRTNRATNCVTVKELKGRLKPEEVNKLKMEELFISETSSVWGTFAD